MFLFFCFFFCSAWFCNAMLNRSRLKPANNKHLNYVYIHVMIPNTWCSCETHVCSQACQLQSLFLGPFFKDDKCSEWHCCALYNVSKGEKAGQAAAGVLHKQCKTYYDRFFRLQTPCIDWFFFYACYWYVSIDLWLCADAQFAITFQMCLWLSVGFYFHLTFVKFTSARRHNQKASQCFDWMLINGVNGRMDDIMSVPQILFIMWWPTSFQALMECN